jgi:hypothetical protein
MSSVWTCDHNHRWSLPADAATLDGPPDCPECGGPGVLISGDETLPPADEPLPVPTLADVHVPGYTLLAELGRGAMGVVYRAREEKLGRPVALKMILAGGHASAGDRARFKREAEAVAALRHANIVQIYSVGEAGGLPYCALEYIEGGNLADHSGGKPLPPERGAALVEQLARAVHFAHERNIVHRDLKPANVLLAEDGTPKVADFGLAKKLGSATGPTATGAVLGTPAYMAPEQAGGEGKEVGPAADTYALGAILYDLLTGRPPFKAATPLDTILQVVSTEPVPPRTVNPKVPRDLETITLKCLRKEPGKRYASASDLADDLGRWQAGEPVTARPLSRSERLWRGLKRQRAWLIAGGFAAIALLLATMLAGIAVWLSGKQSAEMPTRPDNLTPLPVEVPKPGPTVVTAATLEQAKEAVVAVRSTRAGGATFFGSGFLAVEPGIVVTALSVLGMDHPLAPPPERIEVTPMPGTPESRCCDARLLSVDRTENLACLQISTVGLPPPFAIGRSADIREGQKLYTAGVPPLAHTMTPTEPAVRDAIRITPGTVAGRIFSANGSVKYLQYEGGDRWLGSAVFTADGRLVGALGASVADSKMRFAIPAESVSSLLRERVQSIRLGQAVVAEKGSRLPITARVADPLNRLWKLSLDVSTGDANWRRWNADGEPKGLVGEFGRQTFSLTPSPNDRAGPGEDRDFVGEADLPPLPPGKVYWLQPHFRVSRGGQVGGPDTLGDAMSLPEAGPPVERSPVRLTLKPGAWPTPKLRLDLSVRRVMSFGKGGGEERGEEASFAETTSQVDPGEEADLRWRFQSYHLGDYYCTPRRRQIETAMNSVIGYTVPVRLARDGGIKTLLFPDFAEVPVGGRTEIADLTRGLIEALRLVNPPFADRELQPGATWTAESEFDFASGKSASKRTLHFTYTYSGLRDRAGRREAIIEVGGTLAPTAEKDAAGSVIARTTGAYAVDVQTGQVRMARVESDVILEMELPGPAGGAPAKTKIGLFLEIRFQRGLSDGPPIPLVMPLPNGRIEFRPLVPVGKVP